MAVIYIVLYDLRDGTHGIVTVESVSIWLHVICIHHDSAG